MGKPNGSLRAYGKQGKLESVDDKITRPESVQELELDIKACKTRKENLRARRGRKENLGAQGNIMKLSSTENKEGGLTALGALEDTLTA